MISNSNLLKFLASNNQIPILYYNEEIIQKLNDENTRQNALIESLDERMLHMENMWNRRENELKSYFLIKEKVSELLAQRVLQLEQYTRRYSVVVKGIPTKRNESQQSLQDEVHKLLDDVNSATKPVDIDKFHRNGPRDGNQQDIIIRFKSHSAKEQFFKSRKTISETRKFVKIQPSLSPEQKRLFDDSREELARLLEHPDDFANPPDFVLTDVHGNMLLKMKKESEKGLFFRFSNLWQMNNIIMRCNFETEVDKGHDDQYKEFV